MAVQATKIISVEPITISVPIGTQLKITDIPSILYVNYNGAPFHGYVTFNRPDKEKLLVLNPHTNATPTSGTTVRGVPVPIDIAADDTITNIPTDIQQEVLLKGGLKNAVVSNTGGSQGTITSYEPLVFYISILVGGIDWRPASRFPSDIDLLDHIDGYMKEPVTSSDIPAIDAYQYLISLQTRSQAEDYQLESLKQSLSKKMILARDINLLMACILAVERAYFDLLERMKRLENRVDYIEDKWLPNLEKRLYTSQINIKNLWQQLEDNFVLTHQGLIAAREDVYTRVYHGLRHYCSGGWFNVPTFGRDISSTFTINLNTAYGQSYNRMIINRTTGEEDTTISISPSEPGTDGLSDPKYTASVVGLRILSWNSARAWSKNSWGDNTSLSDSGDRNINIDECFHNLIIKDSHRSKGAIITEDQIGFYSSITIGNITSQDIGIFKVRGSNSSAEMMLNDRNAVLSSDDSEQSLKFKDGHYTTTSNIQTLSLGAGVAENPRAEFTRDTDSTKPYTFVGNRNPGMGSAGLVVQPRGDSKTTGTGSEVFITGQRIHFANSSTQQQYFNIYNGDTPQSYVIINVGNGGDDAQGDGGFFIGKTGSHVVMEYESTHAKYCGISFSADGLHLYGLSKITIDGLKELLKEPDSNEDSDAGAGPAASDSEVADGEGGPVSKNISEWRNINKNVFNNAEEYGWRTAHQGADLNRKAYVDGGN